MTAPERHPYTGRVRTVEGWDGRSRSSDGRLDVMLSPPGSQGSGTNPEQLLAAGLSLPKLRELATVIAGAMTGLGGAQLALVGVQLFNYNMTNGRGYIALAAFYFGNSKPLMTAIAAFVFGIAYAVEIRLQTAGLPSQLPQMLPYLAVIVALVVVALRRRSATASLTEEAGVADGLGTAT